MNITDKHIINDEAAWVRLSTRPHSVSCRYYGEYKGHGFVVVVHDDRPMHDPDSGFHPGEVEIHLLDRGVTVEEIRRWLFHNMKFNDPDSMVLSMVPASQWRRS